MTIISAAFLSAALLLTTSTALAKPGWTVKVLVTNAIPGQILTVFQGEHSQGQDSDDPGTAPLESTTPAAYDSRVTELFVPVGMTSAIWIWEQDTGYQFLANIAPQQDQVDPILLDAGKLEAPSLATQRRSSASAFSAITTDAPSAQHTIKVLTLNAKPDQVIAVFQGECTSGDHALDPGIAQLTTTVPAARSGGVTELFVPVGMTSAVWVWEESTGYRFLKNVAPDNNSQPIVLDANEAQVIGAGSQK